MEECKYTNQDIILLYDYSKQLRELLNNCKECYPSLFGTFPNAYCADASLWLCDYLISKGFDSSTFSFRSKDPFIKEGGNHIWLNYQGIDIDITADQFNKKGYNFSQVIVSEKNQNYLLYDDNWLKKDYSAHSYSPICFINEQWNKKYDIIYEKMELKFDLSSVTISI